MKIFGIPIEFDLRAPDLDAIDAKLARYYELQERVEDDSIPDYPEWQQEMEEQVELFYELKDSVAGFLKDETEESGDVKEDPRPWWKLW